MVYMGSLCLSLAILSFPVALRAGQTFFPAAVPLAIRSPHFSMWYNCPAGVEPLQLLASATNGWGGKIRVDGLTYSWMGNYNSHNGTANVTGIQITPTRSIFAMQAGPMNLTVTFLSPFEPSDWVNQSTPFSYLSVEAQSLDGDTHHVQLYSEIGSQFITGIGDDLVRWQTSLTNTTMFHETEPQNLQPYAEISQQAEDGRGYFATSLRPGLTWQIDTDVNTRAQFTQFGKLTNIEQMTFGPMGQRVRPKVAPTSCWLMRVARPWYVFSFAVDLGNIQSTSLPVTWAVGYVRDPVVQYTTPSSGIEVRHSFWTMRYSNISALVDAFLADYPDALDRAVAFDNEVMNDAAKISARYLDLVSLVARQVMAAIDITALGRPDNTVDVTDVKAFMKDIGFSQRVNPAERLFAAFPAYLYFNASLGGALLAPLLELQDVTSGLPYAAQDIGVSYPNATGTHGPHPQGIEQSGNMLIMMYAHARVSGDGTLLARHYDTAKRWADYLVENTLTPSNQDTADGESNANMTNLAIKGIIAVKAMAEMSHAAQQDSDAQHYNSNVQQHLLGQYGDQSSWAMLYNIYADLLLGTNLVSQDVLAKQTKYYKTLLQTEALTLGLPIDNVNTMSNTSSTAWTLLTSATVTDDGVRDQLIQYAWDRASFNKTAGAFPDVYNVATGDHPKEARGKLH
ncbi:hypothetical protein C8T65DRAFT_740959 [Cerioporus squamosus]|nr:hypothetical protein C8T65DRAFT_740959 [Cerioporus squamosus]